MPAGAGLGGSGREISFADAEAAFELVSFEMAQGDGQGVGGVGRFRDFLQVELRANHELYLAFVGVAVAGDRGFYFAGRIAADFDGMLFRGEQDYATDFG